jgi:hypothetical protein
MILVDLQSEKLGAPQSGVVGFEELIELAALVRALATRQE